MNGTDAFDWLVENDYMQVNELGFGYISKPPKKADLDLFVKAVRALGAYSVETANFKATILVSCGCKIDDLRFKKRIQGGGS